jgi:hypothetical protein
VEKYGTAGQATDGNIIRRLPLRVLDVKGYRHTLRIYNTYYVSSVTIVWRTRLNVTLKRTLPVVLNLWVEQTTVSSCNEIALLTWTVISLQKITVKR